MTVIDLTHIISPEMPVYPGTETPRLTPVFTCEKDGFRETLLSMFSHTGTHMDASAHVFSDGTTLDAFPVSQFVGPAAVVDCTDLGPGGQITMEHIARNPAVRQAAFVLFRTGWERFWGEETYFGDYPCITPEVADWLAGSGKKGVGLDTISLDPMAKLVLHRQLFRQHDMVIIENLCNLDRLPGGLFTLCALPLKYPNADGSPVRAVALLED